MWDCFNALSFNQIKYKLKTEKNMSNVIYGAAGMSKTQIWAAGSKTQFYNTDGTGRDLYISLHNGGFCPPTEATKIEELGK